MRYFFVCLLCLLISFHISGQSKEYVFATYTYSSNTRLSNLEPLAVWLSAKSGMKIKAVSYPTVAALIDAIVHDSVDFAMMNTSGYLVLQKKFPAKAIPLVNLTLGNDSLTKYGGCLFASRSSYFNSMRDLVLAEKQPVLALVNGSSTSGNLVPRLLLNDAGIPDAERKFKVYYAGTHRKAVTDVLEGKAQLGGCGCAEIDTAKARFHFDEKAVLIGEFNNIPLGPVVHSNRISNEIKNKIASLLLELHTKDYPVFSNFCNGWTEFKEATNFKSVSDTDYNAFRKMFGNNEALWKMIE